MRLLYWRTPRDAVTEPSILLSSAEEYLRGGTLITSLIPGILLRRSALLLRLLKISGFFFSCMDMKQKPTPYLKTKECSGGVEEEAHRSGGVNASPEGKEKEEGEVVSEGYQKPLPVTRRHLK